MDDDELDALEHAMNAWEDNDVSIVVHNGSTTNKLGVRFTPPPQTAVYHSDTDASRITCHDDNEIVTYIQKKAMIGVTKRTAGQPAAKTRTYGYQEPTLFEKQKPKPRLVPLEERHLPGGWNSSVMPLEAEGRKSAPLRSASIPQRAVPEVDRQVTSAPSKSNAPAKQAVTRRTTGILLSPVKRAAVRHDGVHEAPRSAPNDAPQTVRHDVAATALPLAAASPETAGTPSSLQEALQSELSQKLTEIGLLRAERALLLRRCGTLEEDLQQVVDDLAARRRQLTDMERRVAKARDAKKECGQLMALKRSKENKVVDLRNMLKMCLRRIEEAESSAAVPTQSTARIDDEVSKEDAPLGLLPDINTARKSQHTKSVQKEIQALKAQCEDLERQQKKLAAEKLKLSASIKDLTTKHQLQLEALTKQRQRVVAEMNRRAKAEFEQARQHILRNHEKGMNFRHREQSMANDGEQKRTVALAHDVERVQGQLKLLSKSLSDLHSTESAMRVQLKDAECRCAESDKALAAARQLYQEAVRSNASVVKKHESLIDEHKYVSEKLSDPAELAKVQAVHDGERRAALSSIAQAQDRSQCLVSELAALEHMIGSKDFVLRHPSADASKPLQKSIAELRLRIQLAEEEATRLHKQVDGVEQETEQKKKELQRARKQKQASLDSEIESLTKELASWREKAKQASRDQLQAESQLDLCERMIAMNNLRKK